MEMNEQDSKWVDALKPYWGGGIVPIYWANGGGIDAQATIDRLMQAVGEKKVGPNGEPEFGSGNYPSGSARNLAQES